MYNDQEHKNKISPRTVTLQQDTCKLKYIICHFNEFARYVLKIKIK